MIRPSAFLLRGSISLIAVLALWWVLLQNPLLWLLRVSTEFVFSLLPAGNVPALITVATDSDWEFHVPVDDSRTPAQRGGAQPFARMEFSVPREDVLTYTFSLPLYWAVAIAVVMARGVTRENLRGAGKQLLIGTTVVILAEALCLIAFAKLTAYGGLNPDAWSKWWIDLGKYLVTQVLPFVMPLSVLLAIHRDLRMEILSYTRSGTT